MKFKVLNPDKAKETATVSLRLDKAVWDLLEAAVERTKKPGSPTKFISRQKMVELILRQVLTDNEFKLDIPPDLAKPKSAK